ncbi:imidazolonepropionase-like amidohydrolase [Scopulibacillus darangshiensis]|uniref:Imidazolonepropionase-like amidohydrolase n=1 Tax=Scopulibacillus darangshiensis TaxID=442528 RepID=A0A4R2P8Y3_9BACL|nr:amidohydrolase family protein [Scopulibacillus darangshiensis]TCP31337.1 imidazolonepropionase-like amidohydrolase [Scopulibacillus darangshiensis]
MGYTLVKNGTLIDGSGGETISNAAVLIKDNLIEAVGKLNEIKQPNADIDIVDAENGFILPGLFDTHVHMMMEATDISKSLTTPFSLNFYQAINYMKRTIDTGITSVRDAGFTDFGVKEAVEKGLILGPRLQISINPLTTTGGHGDSWMRSGIDVTRVTYPGMPSGLCDGPEQVRQKVREMLRAGADIVKVHATGGVTSPTDHPEFTQFSQEELEIMVQEASFRRGVKVMAHAQGAEGIKNAVRAGIHSIEHGIFLDDEAIELMLEHGTYLVPTLLAPVAVLEAGEKSSDMPEYAVQKAKESVDIHRESIAKAHKSGVKIAMGTDAGVMPHGTNLRELDLMCKIGMTPMEALAAATKVASECLGWEDHLGTVEAGKLADLVITKTNPIADISSLEDTNNIVKVFKEGQIKKDLSRAADKTAVL